jgi:hypothetical protein
VEKKITSALRRANTQSSEQPDVEEKTEQPAEAKGGKPGHKGGYLATKRAMRHAYQLSVMFPVTGDPVKLAEEDSWLECQVDAGLIKRM